MSQAVCMVNQRIAKLEELKAKDWLVGKNEEIILAAEIRFLIDLSEVLQSNNQKQNEAVTSFVTKVE